MWIADAANLQQVVDGEPAFLRDEVSNVAVFPPCGAEEALAVFEQLQIRASLELIRERMVTSLARLTERARHLLLAWQLPPGAVHLVAFNKRAQEEMRDRTSDVARLQFGEQRHLGDHAPGDDEIAPVDLFGEGGGDAGPAAEGILVGTSWDSTSQSPAF